jgi:hypothetical protein
MGRIKNPISVVAGIALGVVLMLIVNFVNYKINFDATCFDCDNDFGWPFRIYQSGGLMIATDILWHGILLNMVIFGLLGAGFGLIVRKIFK